MSSQLFTNIAKSDTQKTTQAGDSAKNSQTTSEKKEGGSLFDSFLSNAENEMKKETSKAKSTQSEIKKEVVETETTLSSKTEVKQDTVQAEISDEKTETTNSSKAEVKQETTHSDKIEVKQETIDSKTNFTNKVQSNQEAIETNSTVSLLKTNEITDSQEQSNDKSSLQKMVDKLVDLIVSSSKELQTSTQKVQKGSQNTLQTDLVKEKINQLLSDTNGDKSTIDALKTQVNTLLTQTNNENATLEKITSAVSKLLETKTLSTENTALNTVQNEVNQIKQSVETISTVNKDLENIIQNNNLDETNTVDTEIKLTEKVSSSTIEIEKELVSIQEKVQNISQDVENSDEKEITTLAKKITPNLENIDNAVKQIDLTVEDLNSQIVQKNNEKQLEKIPTKIENSVTIIDENVNTIEQEVAKVVVKTTGYVKEESFTPSRVTITQEEITEGESKNSLLSSMFLQSQKTAKETTSLAQVKDAKENILGQKTIEAVKQSAEKLDLSIEEVEVTNEGDEIKKIVLPEIKKDEIATQSAQSRYLNQALMNQKITEQSVPQNQMQNQSSQIMQEQIAKNSISKSEEATIDVVEMSVPKDVAQNLQVKIIGAQQKMGSFMSEVARNMYLNYKPPVTAFRVNLNPANLGSISVMMKANKVDNSLTVSMNLSNSNTMEAFVENKTVLQNALQKQFSDSSNVTLNFDMQNGGSENSFEQSQHNNNNQQEGQEHHKNGSDESTLEEQELVEINDYM